LVGKEREHVELPLSPCLSFWTLRRRISFRKILVMDTAAYEQRKWDVKVAIFFTLKSDLLDQRRFDLYERGI